MKQVSTNTSFPYSYTPEVNTGQYLQEVKAHQAKLLQHRCCGLIVFQHPLTPLILGNATGSLISNNLVLTCAHAVYSKHFGAYFKNLKFYLGVNGQFNEKNCYDVQQYYLPPEYLTITGEEERLYDYALLKLKRNVNSEQFLTLGVDYSISWKDYKVGIYGYPKSEVKFRENYIIAKQLGLERQGKIMSINKNQDKSIIHSISTESGQSGGGFILKCKNIALLVGIHLGGKEEQKYNVARMVTLDLLINMQIWRQSRQGAPFICISLNDNQRINFNDRYIKVAKQMINFERNKTKLQSQSKKNLSISQKKSYEQKIKNLEIQLKRQRQLNQDLMIQLQKIQKKQQILTKSTNNKPSKQFFAFDLNKFAIYGELITLSQQDGNWIKLMSAKTLKNPILKRIQIARYGGNLGIKFGIDVQNGENKHVQNVVDYWSNPSKKSGRIFVGGKESILWDMGLFIEESNIIQIQIDDTSVTFTNIAKNISRNIKVKNLLDGNHYLTASLYHIGASIKIV